uniref:Response regulator transcription factor n=2 Tax=Thermorudis TaxID=1649508 RepID=A0A7C2WBP2_9BACT
MAGQGERAVPSGGLSVDRRRVVVVEDDTTLAELLRYNLERHGYSTWIAVDGKQALMLVRSVRPDLVILDLMLPGIDGLDVCRLIRKWSSVPILMLTARDSEEDIVAGFAVGADDYLTKPFRVRELMARVEAAVRRVATSSGEPRVLTAGRLAIFLDEHRVLYHDREIHLPPKEFALLAALVKRAGQACTRAELLDLVWGQEVIVDPRNIDVHIRRIRAALEGEPDGSHLIQTVHGVGYRFTPDASEWAIVETGGEQHGAEEVD